MPKKITYEIARKRFEEQGRDDIVLCKDGFAGWKKKAKFWDKIEKNYFWSVAESVYSYKTSHPKRSSRISASKRSVKLDEAKRRFADRKDIKIIDKTYISWDKKAQFYDKIQKEYWWAVPKKVHCRKSVHPKRASQKRKEKLTLSIEKARKKFIKQKRSDIFLCEDEYTSWSKKAKFYDLVEKDYFWSRPADVYKLKTVHPNRRIDKKKKTYEKNWGVDNFAKTIQFREMHKKRSMLDVNSANYSQRFIIETGQHIKEWWDGLPVDYRPGYSHIKQIIPNRNISLRELNEFLENWNSGKTALESFTENVFNKKHYNKKPKEIQKPYRPDFKLTSDVFLNVDGLYWHSEVQKDKWYHFNLRKEFEDNGLKIFQFRENEIKNKSKIVKSIVNSFLKNTENKILARTCKAKTISQSKAKIFLNENHLLGAVNAKHVGLFYREQLVAILSYKYKNNICKIVRFCFLNEHIVFGGFYKLLKYLEQSILKSNIIESHVQIDLRYETDTHLRPLGFERMKDILEWEWTNGKSTHKKTQLGSNWVKIYDAGQRLYIKRYKFKNPIEP